MKLKRPFLFVFLFFIIGFNLAGQITVKGTVVDEDQRAIPFANIVSEQLNTDQFPTGTTTDSSGNFLLELSEIGDYIISIKYLGFQTWKDTLMISEDLDLGVLVIKQNAKDLETIIVSAERSVIELKEDKLLFNVQSSPLKEGYDGVELLDRTPNIWVSQNGGILIRNEQATVMVNGRPLKLSGADLSDYLRSLSSEDIRRIEVQTSLSANLDGEQSGGVVNIITKRIKNGFQVNGRANYLFKEEGDYRGNASVRVNYGSKKWNVYGNYNRLRNTSTTEVESEIFYFNNNDYLNTKQRNRDSLLRETYRLGFVYSLDNTQYIGGEIFGRNSAFDFFNNNQLSFSNQGDILDNGATFFGGEVNTRALNATLNYSKSFKSFPGELKVFADRTSQESTRDNRAESVYLNGFFPDTLERNAADAATLIDAVQLDWKQVLAKNWQWEAGLKWTNTQRSNALLSEYFVQDLWLANERTTDFDYDEQIKAVYSSWAKSFGEKYYIKAGIRLEQTQLERDDMLQDTSNSQEYLNYLPSFYFSQKINDQSKLSFSYSRRISRPSFGLLNNNIRKINDFRYEIGNPDLSPEYRNNFELKFGQKQQSFALYYSLTTDAINGIFFLEDAVSFYQKVNSGSQKQWSFQYNRFGKIKPWWQLKAGALFYYRKFTNPEGEDSFERATARLSLSNVIKLGKTTQLDIGGYYISPRADAFYVAAERYTINFMLQNTFFDKRLMCRIYISDIFNTLVYANVREFDTFKTTSDRKPQTRTINFWMSYTFNSKNKVSTRKVKSQNEASRRIE